MNRKLMMALLPLFFITGCSALNPMEWFGDEDNSEPPAELVDIENRIPVNKVWSQDVGEGSGELALGLALVEKDGLLFVADQTGIVKAIATESQKTEWQVDTGVAVSGGPGVADDLVLVGSEEAEIIALNMNDGSERWRKALPGEVLSAPSGESGVVVVQTSNDRLIGLDALNGDELWQEQGKVTLLSLRGAASPLVDDDVVYSGHSNGKLSAVELSTGVELWSTVIAYPSGRGELNRMVDVDSSPSIYEGVVYVGAFQGKIAAISASSGVVLWDKKLSTHLPISADWRNVYVTDANSHVWGLDPRNGTALWQQKSLRLRSLTTPVVFNDYVVVGDYEGYIHWLSIEDGSIHARQKVSSASINVTPIVINDSLYVYASDGTLAVYESGQVVESE